MCILPSQLQFQCSLFSHRTCKHTTFFSLAGSDNVNCDKKTNQDQMLSQETDLPHSHTYYYKHNHKLHHCSPERSLSQTFFCRASEQNNKNVISAISKHPTQTRREPDQKLDLCKTTSGQILASSRAKSHVFTKPTQNSHRPKGKKP